jgi:hypothetical protein
LLVTHTTIGVVHQQGVSQAIPQEKRGDTRKIFGVALPFFWDNNGVLLFVTFNIESFPIIIKSLCEFS